MIRQGNIQLRSVFGAGPEDQQQWFVSGDREPVGNLAGSDGEPQRGTETFRAALIIFEADESYPRRLVEDNLPAAFFSQRHSPLGSRVGCPSGATPFLFGKVHRPLSAPPHLLCFPLCLIFFYLLYVWILYLRGKNCRYDYHAGRILFYLPVLFRINWV